MYLFQHNLGLFMNCHVTHVVMVMREFAFQPRFLSVTMGGLYFVHFLFVVVCGNLSW